MEKGRSEDRQFLYCLKEAGLWAGSMCAVRFLFGAWIGFVAGDLHQAPMDRIVAVAGTGIGFLAVWGFGLGIVQLVALFRFAQLMLKD